MDYWMPAYAGMTTLGRGNASPLRIGLDGVKLRSLAIACAVIGVEAVRRVSVGFDLEGFSGALERIFQHVHLRERNALVGFAVKAENRGVDLRRAFDWALRPERFCASGSTSEPVWMASARTGPAARV
jgi:hypothetical protein